jgi:hypothetical protein
MRCILADFELINPPAAGCPIPPPRLYSAASPEINPDNLQLMVTQVFDEMKNRGLL